MIESVVLHHERHVPPRAYRDNLGELSDMFGSCLSLHSAVPPGAFLFCRSSALSSSPCLILVSICVATILLSSLFQGGFNRQSSSSLACPPRNNRTSKHHLLLAEEEKRGRACHAGASKSSRWADSRMPRVGWRDAPIKVLRSRHGCLEAFRVPPTSLEKIHPFA